MCFHLSAFFRCTIIYQTLKLDGGWRINRLLFMNYKTFEKQNSEMSASDLCDAIVEARDIDIPEVVEATKMLVLDLRDVLLSSDELFYLESQLTKSPYINEHFSVFIFDDKYYAEKFIDAHPVLKLEVKSVKNSEYESLISKFYDAGADGVDYCNDESSITLGIKHFLLSDDYNHSISSARVLNRFVCLCMQEIRNDEKLYDRKAEIVDLLKKNIVAEALTNSVFMPIKADKDAELLTDKIVKIKENTPMNIVSIQAQGGEVLFPVYTNENEFTAMQNDIKLVQTSMLGFIEFVNQAANSNKSIVGICVNPETVNFAMIKPILEIVVANKNAK